MRVGVDQLRRDSDALPFLRTQPSGAYRTPSRFAALLSAPGSLPHAGAGLARGYTAPRTTAVRRRQPPLANRVRVAGRNAHRDRSVTQDAPIHAGGVASIRGNIAVDDLHAVAIFRAAVPGSRMNDHAPTPVERIGPGRRSFGWSRSNSCGRGRPRADRRAWHHGRNWHDGCQCSEVALPDGPAIELDRRTVDGIDRAFMPRVRPRCDRVDRSTLAMARLLH